MPKVVIVEDNLMIADMTEAILVGHGYTVCGIARTIAQAVALCRLHHPDLAVIDIQLEHGELGSAIPAALGGLGQLGVLYATGNMHHASLISANGHACLSKVFRAPDLLRALDLVTELVATGQAGAPFPSGFRILEADPAGQAVTPHG